MIIIHVDKEQPNILHNTATMLQGMQGIDLLSLCYEYPKIVKITYNANYIVKTNSKISEMSNQDISLRNTVLHTL